MSPPNVSLILVMVCFWITFWLAQKLIIKPVGDAVAERTKRIKTAEAAWESKHQEYLSATTRLEGEMEEAARAAARIRADVRNEALDRRQELLTAARERADARLAEAMEGLEADAAAARTDLRRRAQELSRVLASQLLGREV
jgi:F0F1-type ATP synthase membrane subunit b/b'